MMSIKNHIEKLPNAPLQEVVFELLWEMDFDNFGKPVDLNFEFAQGIFAEKIKKEFPFHKRTVPEEFPLTIYPKPVHQFWKNENLWPVVQIGPGILVINDIEKNYTWKDYKNLIIQVLGILSGAYDKELKYITVSLKYIDAVEITQNNYLDFINNNFNIRLDNNFNNPGSITNIKINETFAVDEIGKFDILISSGMSRNNQPAIIWQSNIFNNGKFHNKEILSWIEEAHNIVSDHFKKIVKKPFYASFNNPK
jgi:uncharacterized protein (TIGR04255 family)